jgi:hypothetical protein
LEGAPLVEYALLTAKTAIETLLANFLNWIDSTRNIFRDYIPDFPIGGNIGGIFDNAWVLVIIAGLVLIIVLELRR